MRMFLIRHGTAEAGSPQVSDDERALSPLGETETTRVGLYLGAIENKFRKVWASPLKRARQTAENIAKSTGFGDIKLTEILEPQANPVDLAKWLRLLASEENSSSVALVGHQPSLGKAVSIILGTKDDLMVIEPATIIELAFEDRPNDQGVRLIGLLNPASIPFRL